MRDERSWINDFICEFLMLQDKKNKCSDNDLELKNEKSGKFDSPQFKLECINQKDVERTVSDEIYRFMAAKLFDLLKIPNITNYQINDIWIKLLYYEYRTWDADNLACITPILGKGISFNKKNRAKSFEEITNMKEFRILCERFGILI